MRTVFEVDSFPQYLRLCMAADGVSLEDLAESLIVHPYTVCWWRDGTKVPSGGHLGQLLSALPSMNINTACHLWTGGEGLCFRVFGGQGAPTPMSDLSPTVGTCLAPLVAELQLKEDARTYRYTLGLYRVRPNATIESLALLGTYEVSAKGWKRC